MIDYNSFANMDRKELEKIFDHIKNILEVRDKMIIESFREKDLSALKELLKNDSQQKIPDDAWQSVNFMRMQQKDLDFFLFIRELPNFEQNDNAFTGLSITNQVIYHSFKNKEFFNFLVDHPDFSEKVKEMAFEIGDSKETSKEVIGELLKRNLLLLSKSPVNWALHTEKENYIEFFLENKKFEFSEEDYIRAYIIGWKNYNQTLMGLVKERLPEYKDIPFKELIDSIKPASQVNVFYEKIKTFLNFDDGRFIETIKNHSVTETDIGDLLACFIKASPTQDEKYAKFVELIVSDFPKHIETLKSKAGLIRFGSFKKTYQKSLNYIDLCMNLEKKEDMPAKKMKI